MNRGRHHRRRRVGAHATGVRSAVAIITGFVVLGGRQRQRVGAVADTNEAGLFAIEKLFDDLGTPEVFDYKEAVAQHIPFISITRMVGIPEKYWPEIRKVILTFTETWNPTISDEQRESARQDCNKAIDIIREVIAQRRASPEQDDFLSTLLRIEAENDKF